MLLARLCRTASATWTQSSFMLPSTVIKPAHSSKIQGIKLFAATRQESSSSSRIKKDDFQKNEANESKTVDKIPHVHQLAIHNKLKSLFKLQLCLNCYGENRNKCRYDRTPPDVDKRKMSNSWNETDVHNYTLHYNILKNIIEFSVHPRVSKLKELMKKYFDGREDDYCTCGAVIALVAMGKNIPEIKFKYDNKLKDMLSRVHSRQRDESK